MIATDSKVNITFTNMQSGLSDEAKFTYSDSYLN